MAGKARKEVVEIAVVGETEDWVKDVIEQMIDLPPGSECVFLINSPGGCPHDALAVLAMLRHRKLKATGIVLGECSSSALLLMAACQKRLVWPFSVCLFHPLRWQSAKRATFVEAKSWFRHFEQLEEDLDTLLIQLFGVGEKAIRNWTAEECFVTGKEMVAAGLAEMMPGWSCEH